MVGGCLKGCGRMGGAQQQGWWVGAWRVAAGAARAPVLRAAHAPEVAAAADVQRCEVWQVQGQHLHARQPQLEAVQAAAGQQAANLGAGRSLGQQHITT